MSGEYSPQSYDSQPPSDEAIALFGAKLRGALSKNPIDPAMKVYEDDGLLCLTIEETVAIAQGDSDIVYTDYVLHPTGEISKHVETISGEEAMLLALNKELRTETEYELRQASIMAQTGCTEAEADVIGIKDMLESDGGKRAADILLNFLQSEGEADELGLATVNAAELAELSLRLEANFPD
ncbi:MAG: hypothetical protein JWN38_552 [Candidatus Saccharibacteria bacterium]|nr:hypothetical protein [Candidatus Saccharibacteria bacterium]